MKTILLAGATGNLGGLTARALLTKGAKLRLLVRPGSRVKISADVAAASEIVEGEAGAFDGVYTVVSAVQGGPETIVDAQLKFLRAARAAGTRRFIPSSSLSDLKEIGCKSAWPVYISPLFWSIERLLTCKTDKICTYRLRVVPSIQTKGAKVLPFNPITALLIAMFRVSNFLRGYCRLSAVCTST